MADFLFGTRQCRREKIYGILPFFASFFKSAVREGFEPSVAFWTTAL
jgi:hypothetical protein